MPRGDAPPSSGTALFLALVSVSHTDPCGTSLRSSLRSWSHAFFILDLQSRSYMQRALCGVKNTDAPELAEPPCAPPWAALPPGRPSPTHPRPAASPSPCLRGICSVSLPAHSPQNPVLGPCYISSERSWDIWGLHFWHVIMKTCLSACL